MEKRISFLIILILITFACKKENKPLTPVAPQGTINWREFSLTNSGLPELYITAIAVDADNNKWIGTNSSGLVKFDGENWTIYDSLNSCIPCDRITALGIDVSGDIWLGTYNDKTRAPMLIKFDGVDCIKYDSKNSALHDEAGYSIRIITFDQNGGIWIGTVNYGMIGFDGNNWSVYNMSNCILKGNQINSIEVDKSNNIWIGTDFTNRAVKFDGNNWIVYPDYDVELHGYGSLSVGGIAFDSKGHIWINTNAGLIESDFVNCNVHSGFCSSNLSGLLIDKGDNISVVCRGLSKFDGFETKHFENPILSESLDNCSSIDLLDNIWIGTDKGLLVFHEGGVILQ